MTTSRGTLDGDRSDAGTLLPPGGQRRRLYLAGLPRPVARAREFTGQTLADWSWAAPASGVDPDVVDDVLLLVAELIANAMMHADGPLELVLQAFGARLRIEVSDATTALPVPRRPHHPGLPGGHGLFIVERVADRWGAERHGQGKTVWAEVDVDRLAPGR
ncbi:ATP-binding protein [Streptomyces sp. 1331.2]|uniref:ATP-binding protein n=1 Tax=Streptomyces sp. 1331.2 TaxID=1938835 RepID=UPI000BDA074E|nr:ATP-binding protein [Streptomyces sp. 1331.2]SOB88761.1 Histidine kinase-like ATPase domain-containing protein [Streptomyces sp. 1331.2]